MITEAILLWGKMSCDNTEYFNMYNIQTQYSINISHSFLENNISLMIFVVVNRFQYVEMMDLCSV